jgi:hypothetical protein
MIVGDINENLSDNVAVNELSYEVVNVDIDISEVLVNESYIRPNSGKSDNFLPRN